MNFFKSLLTAICLMVIGYSVTAQSLDIFPNLNPKLTCNMENYKDCAAILFNGKMLVDDYSPKGKVILEQGMKGMISVSTVTLNDKGGIPVKQLAFRVAIKNKRTNTLYMFSEQTYTEILFEEIFKKCEQGDNIIIMTIDQKYALPHHEIEVLWGC